MPDLKRVEQFVGMLGSEHDGERANAARFLHKMAEAEKQSMVEFFRSTFGGSTTERVVYRDRTVYRDREPEKPQPSDTSKNDSATRQRAKKAYGYGSMEGKIRTVKSYHWSKLTEFEKEFIDSVLKKVQDGLDLTPKQRNVLATIFDKVGV